MDRNWQGDGCRSTLFIGSGGDRGAALNAVQVLPTREEQERPQNTIVPALLMQSNSLHNACTVKAVHTDTLRNKPSW